MVRRHLRHRHLFFDRAGGRPSVSRQSQAASGASTGASKCYERFSCWWIRYGEPVWTKDGHEYRGGLRFEPRNFLDHRRPEFSPREFHSATVLPSGLVFVAGGVNDRLIGLASTELYNSALGTFSTGGDMTSSRAAHTATLLRDGTVLLAGGNSFTNGVFDPLSSAEIYDPTSGIFTATGSMSVARQNHSATLLKNGLVLIAGGQNNSGKLASAELYDPSTHTFTPTGSLITGRDSQTANLLVDGTVLIAGGVDSNGIPLVSAELYDPTTGTFASTGN